MHSQRCALVCFRCLPTIRIEQVRCCGASGAHIHRTELPAFTSQRCLRHLRAAAIRAIRGSFESGGTQLCTSTSAPMISAWRTGAGAAERRVAILTSWSALALRASQKSAWPARNCRRPSVRLSTVVWARPALFGSAPFTMSCRASSQVRLPLQWTVC